MAKLAIELIHTAKEMLKLEKALVRVNIRRAALGTPPPGAPLPSGIPMPPPFPTVVDWITDECQQLLTSHVESQREIERQGIRSAYASATEAQQAEIDAILGIT